MIENTPGKGRDDARGITCLKTSQTNCFILEMNIKPYVLTVPQKCDLLFDKLKQTTVKDVQQSAIILLSALSNQCKDNLKKCIEFIHICKGKDILYFTSGLLRLAKAH